MPRPPQQPLLPTVGDTLTITQHISVPLGAVVQARAPADSTIATLVAPPLIVREGDSVRIAYTVALWAPGHSLVVIPGPIVVTLQGRVDTLSDARIAVDVASVLPSGRPRSALVPRAARPWIPRADMSLLPFAVLLPLALLVVGWLQWRWRRRDPSPILAEPIPATRLDEPRLDAWLAAGEARLALEHLEWLVRDRASFAEWRVRADALRFAPGDGSELEALVREGWARAQEHDVE